MKRNNLPSKTKIRLHWAKKYNDDYFITAHVCWGCGFALPTERAHLFAHWCGGNEEEDNLILLCSFCHTHIQERMATTAIEADKIRQLITSGISPFMDIRIRFFQMLIEKNLIPEHIMTEAEKKIL